MYTPPDYSSTHPGRQPTARVHAYLPDRGRVWVESIDRNAYIPTAFVRFDCGDGTRSPGYHVALTGIDFTREWKFT